MTFLLHFKFNQIKQFCLLLAIIQLNSLIVLQSFPLKFVTIGYYCHLVNSAGNFNNHMEILDL